MSTRLLVTGCVCLFWAVMMGWLVKVEYLDRSFTQPDKGDSNTSTFQGKAFLKRLRSDRNVKYNLLSEGSQIGNSVRNVVEGEKGNLIVNRALTIHQIAGMNFTTRVTGETVYDMDANIRKFRVSFQFPLQFRLEYHGEKVGDEFRLYSGQSKNNEIMRLKHGKKKGISHSLNPLSGHRFPAPGKSRVVRIIDPRSQSPYKCRIRTAPTLEKIDWNGSSIQTYRIVMRSLEKNKPMQATAWISKQGYVLRQKLDSKSTPVPFVIERTTPLPKTPSEENK